jgi:two-component system heavy metal sensor histidine kinase CusS
LAHELRTPLQNLMGEAEVILSRQRTPEEYRQILESSLEEYGTLSRTIKELLFLARAENPQTAIQRARLDVRREIDSVFEFHDAQFHELGITVTRQGDAYLDADPLLFRRALNNLISNAVRHTPKGGEIRLTARRPEADLVEVAVSDTGCGIPAEHLSKIGDRFYRPDRTHFVHRDGAGLGLAIVKSIMALHGGSIAIESVEGTGTTVFLRFPSPLRGTEDAAHGRGAALGVSSVKSGGD